MSRYLTVVRLSLELENFLPTLCVSRGPLFVFLLLLYSFYKCFILIFTFAVSVIACARSPFPTVNIIFLFIQFTHNTINISQNLASIFQFVPRI